MRAKFIHPFTDFGFKKLFGEEANKDLLIDFLNQLLPPEDQIKDLSYQKNEHFPRAEEDRRAIFDLYCENQDGEKFIIELQRAKQKYFKDRSIYYASFPIQEQAEPGKEWQFQLKGVYTIGIMDFLFDEKKDHKDKLLHHVKLVELETQEVFYDKLTFIYLETPKFTKTKKELKTHFDKWMYLLRNLHHLEERPIELQERIFNRFLDVAELSKYNKEELFAYEESLKAYRDYYSTMETAKETARLEGKEEGKIETVKGFLQLGLLSDEQIAKAANIEIPLVEQIRKELER